MKLLVNLLNLLCIQGFIILNARHLPDELIDKTDSVIVILFEKDTFQVSRNDTIRISHPKHEKGKLDFRGKVFTDFVGYNDDNPNGLVQTNVYFSFKPYESGKTFSFLRNIVLADLTFSKIEENNRNLPVRYSNPNISDSIQGYFNRLDLFQYSFFQAVTKINLVSLKYREAFYIYLDFIGTFYSTAITDTINRDNTKNILSLAPGFNIKLNTNEDPKTKLSADLSYTHLWPKMYSDSYHENALKQYVDYKGEMTSYMIQEKLTGIDIVDLTIKHSSSSLTQFLKVSISGNYFSLIEEKAKNIFFQLQLGLSVDLEDIFKKDKDNNKKG